LRDLNLIAGDVNQTVVLTSFGKRVLALIQDSEFSSSPHEKHQLSQNG
jgi:hypothetical protein